MKPVFRQTALRTCLRSLPFNVRPAPSSTEHDNIGEYLESTISCGGNITPLLASSSSPSGTTSSNSLALLRNAAGITGTFTGADWWWSRTLSACGGGGLGIIILDEIDVAGEVDEEEERDAEAEALWLNTGRVSGPAPDPDRILILPFRAAKMP